MNNIEWNSQIQVPFLNALFYMTLKLSKLWHLRCPPNPLKFITPIFLSNLVVRSILDEKNKEIQVFLHPIDIDGGQWKSLQTLFILIWLPRIPKMAQTKYVIIGKCFLGTFTKIGAKGIIINALFFMFLYQKYINIAN